MHPPTYTYCTQLLRSTRMTPIILVLPRHPAGPTTINYPMALGTNASYARATFVLRSRLLHLIALIWKKNQQKASHRTIAVQRSSWLSHSHRDVLQTWAAFLRRIHPDSRIIRLRTGDWVVLQTITAKIGSLPNLFSHSQNLCYRQGMNT